jgi:F420H(2)-dependent quinone reductase
VHLRPAAIRAMGRSHRAIYSLTRGRLLGRVAGMPVLLLTTTGRRSGRPRTTPLTYFEFGTDLVVVASNGGEDRPPGWWLNLCGNPRATVTRGTKTEEVEARAATDDEYAHLWPTITSAYAGYAAYARRMKRPIPVMLLSNADGLGTNENAPGR